MKRINRKGFTLIELLAVIVILAIIVVVTVPTILNSINDARLSSLHSLAKEVANQYDTLLAQDQLATGSNKVLGNAIVPDDGEWHCLKNIKKDDNNSLFEIFDLSESAIYPGDPDANINELENWGAIDDTVIFNEVGMANSYYKGSDLCSSIRINSNGKTEILLIAAEGGKFDTGWDDPAYAVSFGSNGYDEVSSED